MRASESTALWGYIPYKFVNLKPRNNKTKDKITKKLKSMNTVYPNRNWVLIYLHTGNEGLGIH